MPSSRRFRRKRSGKNVFAASLPPVPSVEYVKVMEIMLGRGRDMMGKTETEIPNMMVPVSGALLREAARGRLSFGGCGDGSNVTMVQVSGDRDDGVLVQEGEGGRW